MERVKVLFVCLGNICRSPLAAGIFKTKVQKRGWAEAVEVDSCGTSDYHIGRSPDERTQHNAIKNGVPLHHKARQLSESDLEHFDLIVAMDKSNRRNILALDHSNQYGAKIMLMRHYDLEGGEEVPDPYYGGERGFQEVFEILDRSTDLLLDFIEREYFSRMNQTGNLNS